MLKYLNPLNIVVLHGFEKGEEIAVQITEIAVMQLLDATCQSNSKDRSRFISGIDQIFLAPELSDANGARITEKADSWSLGVILYLLITGGNFDHDA